MAVAYIALGSNIGNPLDNLQRAVDAFALIPHIKVVAVSKVYETAPVGYDDQDNFLNAVIKVETDFTPDALLGACLGVEAGLGRIREIKNGPRILDADLILFGAETIDSAFLTLPHREMQNRAFVMVPFMDICSENIDFYSEIAAHLDKSGVFDTDYTLKIKK